VRADEALPREAGGGGKHFFESRLRPLLLAKWRCPVTRSQNSTQGCDWTRDKESFQVGDSGAAVGPFPPDESAGCGSVRREIA